MQLFYPVLLYLCVCLSDCLMRLDKQVLRTLDLNERPRRLQTVLFCRRDINEIEADTFHDQPQLKRVRLPFNKLSILNSQMFQHLNSLEELNLESNSISQIESDSFDHLNKLQVLKLNSNKLSSLPNSRLFYELNKLVELDLSSNQLDYLNEDLFKGLDSLQILKLNKVFEFNSINIVAFVDT